MSTVGLAPAIPRFIAETRVNLAVSLHATTDAQRERLMPVNRRYPLADAARARAARCRSPRRKRITFEYVMLAGENDADADARAAGAAAARAARQGEPDPLQPVPGRRLRAEPARADRRASRRSCAQHGLNATIRESRGQDIQAACGQLAAARPAA